MKYLKLYFVFLSFFICSIFTCKEEVKPQLSDEKLVGILTDLHFAEAAILSLNRKLKDSVSKVYYQQIFEIHEVIDSVFYKDFEIIRKQPERVEELYVKVSEKIDEFEQKKTGNITPKKKK